MTKLKPNGRVCPILNVSLWSIKEDKLGRIVSMLKEAMDADQLEQRFLKSLYGKLEHVR